MKRSTDLEIPRLCDCIDQSRRALERFRTNRKKMVKQLVGYHWSENGFNKPVPINLISHYTSIISRYLIAKNPRVMLSVFDRAHKPTVKAMQSWANKEIERMYLANTLARAAVDALFSIGIVKVARADPGEAALVGWGLGAGQPYCECIDLDDWVVDMKAADFTQVGFEGHRVRVPRVAAVEMLGKRAKLLPPADELRQYNEQGDERIRMLGQTYQGENTEYEDMVTLWEIYIPRERLILTLGSDEGGTPLSTEEPLLQQRWIGPYCGPYHHLCFQTIPGNLMPKGPIQDLYDLHMQVNNLQRKIIRAGERLKEVNLVVGGSTEDANTINDAADGTAVSVGRIDSVKPAVFGGLHIQMLQGLATYAKMLFNELGGNLALLSGAAPQAPTATQDRMLNQNASAGVSDKQETMITFTSKVLESLLWNFHHDPHQVQRSKKSVAGAEAVLQVTPEHRGMVPFEEMDVKVDPYSLQHQTPQERMQAINSVLNQWAPFAQLAAAQGIQVDWNFYYRKMAELLDQPDLVDLMTIQEPAPSMAGGNGEPGVGMQPNTSRTYERVSRSERTQEGTGMDAVARLMGHNLGGGPETKNGAA